MIRRAIMAAAPLVVACGGSPVQNSPTGGIGTVTSGSGSSGSTGSSTSSGSDSTGAAGDPSYPPPQPVAPDGTCPPDTFGPITFDGSAWVCIPACNSDSTCPDPGSGTAMAACATNPDSSATPCASDADCTVDGEACGNAGGGMRECLLPPSHCILRCDDTMTCPDTMVCTVAGVCAYPT